MKNQKKRDYAHKLLQKLINDNFTALGESKENTDFKFGLLDANKRLIKLQVELFKKHTDR